MGVCFKQGDPLLHPGGPEGLGLHMEHLWTVQLIGVRIGRIVDDAPQRVKFCGGGGHGGKQKNTFVFFFRCGLGE